MVEAISSYNGSSDELYELRKALLSDVSNKKLSNKKEEEPAELSKKQIREEIALSSKSEETEEEPQEEVQEQEGEIVVNATEIGILASSNIEIQANIESENSDYNEDMDYDKDGVVTDEERIRYYSEKFENSSSTSSENQTDAAFEVPNFENLNSEKKTNTTNPIEANMSLINKMQANYGKTIPEVKSNLTILV